MKIIVLLLLVTFCADNAYSQLTPKDSADFYFFKYNRDSARLFFNKIDENDHTPNTLFYKALCEMDSDSQQAIFDFTKSLNMISKNKLNDLVISEELRNSHLTTSGLPMGEIFSLKYRDAYYWRANIKFDKKDYYGCLADLKTYQTLIGGITPNLMLLRGKCDACIGEYTAAITSLTNVITNIPLKNAEQIETHAVREAYYYRGMSRLLLKQKSLGYQDLSKSADLGYEKAIQEIKNQ